MGNAKVTIQDIESRLWDSADELRANSGLKASEYSIPVLGLIFLKCADSRFWQVEAELAGRGSGRRKVGKTNYQARGVMYLPAEARFATLLELEEGKDLGQALNDAMGPSSGRTRSCVRCCPAPTRRCRTPRSPRCCAT